MVVYIEPLVMWLLSRYVKKWGFIISELGGQGGLFGPKNFPDKVLGSGQFGIDPRFIE